MNAKIQEVNFNPYWTVPASIIKKDLIPKMQKEPSYLTDNKIRIFNGDREIPPSQVNWHSDEATRYRFRQDPGVDLNSMGFVRINIPNPHGVYMHDTPAKGVFGDDFRFVSSGCIRLQNVRDYVAFLLRESWLGDEPQAGPEAFAAAGARVVVMRSDSPQRETFERASGWRAVETVADRPLVVFVRGKFPAKGQ